MSSVSLNQLAKSSADFESAHEMDGSALTNSLEWSIPTLRLRARDMQKETDASE
jgi:hypothetical protein